MPNANRVTAGMAELQDVRLYYEIAGEGDWLVLVHAGIADRRMWDAQFHAFAGHFRVLRYDMRGHGNSMVPAGAFSHRKDLYRLLQHLGVEKAHFLGASMGGAAVIDLALEHPGLAGSIILAGPALSGFAGDGKPSQEMQELIAARTEGDFLKAAELQVRIWVDGPRRGPDQVNPRIRERVRQMSYNALTLQAGLLRKNGFLTEERLNPPAAGRLSELTAPLLVLVGREDSEDCHRVADHLSRRAVRARKEILARAAHFPNMERPRVCRRMVLDFLLPNRKDRPA